MTGSPTAIRASPVRSRGGLNVVLVCSKRRVNGEWQGVRGRRREASYSKSAAAEAAAVVVPLHACRESECVLMLGAGVGAPWTAGPS